MKIYHYLKEPFIYQSYFFIYVLFTTETVREKKMTFVPEKYFIVYSVYYNYRNSSTWMWSGVYSCLMFSDTIIIVFWCIIFTVCWYIIFTFWLMFFQPWYSFVYFVANSLFIWFCKFPCFIITIVWRLCRWLVR